MALGALFSSRRIWLFISLFNNLCLLLFFKYAGFVVENFNALAAFLMEQFNALAATHFVATQLPPPGTLMPYGFKYLLPVGISFFTFQSLSYTIDFYLGNVPRERHFLRFATFVCFYPPVDGRPYRTGEAIASAVPRVPASSSAELHRRGVALPGRAVQKTGAGELPCALRRSGLRPSGGFDAAGAGHWRPSPSPGRSIATSAATPTWPAASPR